MQNAKVGTRLTSGRLKANARIRLGDSTVKNVARQRVSHEFRHDHEFRQFQHFAQQNLSGLQGVECPDLHAGQEARSDRLTLVTALATFQ
jgi:hypothetical protein